MNSIVVPVDLLKLPHPWCVTSNSKREKLLPALNPTPDAIETALIVMDSSLQILSNLNFPTTNSLPDNTCKYWSFSADWIAENIPTFDKFEVAHIQEFLAEEILAEEHLEGISDLMIEEAANYWIWYTTFRIAGDSSRWLEKILKNHEDSLAISSFLNIVTRYWQVTPSLFAFDLIVSAARIAGKDSLPLLESVEKTATDASLQNIAQDYQKWIRNPNL